MKKAIEFLRTKGITVSDDGIILSALPDNEEGLSIVDELEELTMNDEFFYNIVNNKLTRQYF